MCRRTRSRVSPRRATRCISALHQCGRRQFARGLVRCRDPRWRCRARPRARHQIRERRICDELVEEVFVAVVRGVFPLARGENRVRVGGRSVGRATTFSACPPRRDVFVSQERVLAVARGAFSDEKRARIEGLAASALQGIGGDAPDDTHALDATMESHNRERER